MNKLKLLLLTGILLLTGHLYGQTQEWNVNVTTNTGERVIAVLNAGTIGPYTGIIVVGQIIDNNGNWGYTIPNVSDFRVFVRFSNGINTVIEQSAILNNVKLRLRQVAPNRIHLIAYCPNVYRNIRITLRKTDGAASLSLGPTDIINSEGTLINYHPVYTSRLSGTVNIGDNALAGMLNVNGNIRAKEVKVETANWPDYVFGEDYELPDIRALASYIKSHKHLPGVPTAAEVEAEGIELGEMNRILLEKVEELTRYVIQLKMELDMLAEKER